MTKEEIKGSEAQCSIGEETIDSRCLFSRDCTLNKKPRLFLHSCCGPCSTAVIERLVEDYDITIYFYNPNITDEREYLLRRDTQIEFIEKFNLKNNCNIKFIEGIYNPDDFFHKSKGFEGEKEGGARCNGCFQLRLESTAREALKLGYQIFATVLTVSPYKNYKLISEIGNEISSRLGIEFLDMDFKKKNGFQRSIELSKEYGLYRQHYCGCIFSER